MGRSSRSSCALKRLEDHNTSPEREKSVSKAGSKKSASSGYKQVDSSRCKDGGKRDSGYRKECDSRDRSGSVVERHSHSVPHGRAGSTNAKSTKYEDKNSVAGSKTVGSDRHSTATSRKKDGDDKSQNGRDSKERGRKRSRSCSPVNMAAQAQVNAGGKNGSHASGDADGKVGPASKKARSSPSRVRREVSLSASPSSSGSESRSVSSQGGRFKRKCEHSDSARLLVGSNSPRWARDKFENSFQCQQLNEERLGRIEAGLRKHTALEEKERFSRPSYKFEKKVYEDQFSFNLSVVDHLCRVLDSDDPFQKEYQINEGINKIVKRNKRLILADRHGWATAEAYERDPIADDSSDEKRIKRAKKEAQSFLEEKARTKKVRVMSRKRNFRNSGGPRPFSSGFSFSNVYPQEPRSFPLHVGAVSAQATLQESAKRQFLQTQLSSEANVTILSRDRVLDIECDSDFNFSFDLK